MGLLATDEKLSGIAAEVVVALEQKNQRRGQ